MCKPSNNEIGILPQTTIARPVASRRASRCSRATISRQAARRCGDKCSSSPIASHARISATFFAQWLEKNGYSRFMFQKTLVTELGAKEINGRMGAGTPLAVPNERLIEIDLSKTTHANFLDEV